MDFRSRGVQSPNTSTSSSSAGNVSSSSSNSNDRFGKIKSGKWLERGSFILLIAITIIILAIAGLTFLSGNNQAAAVRKDNFQAVFLNNGQVYFGNIKKLGGESVDLRNIYYLQTANANGQEADSSTNVSLVKLGCELHAPFDQMLINADQVLFWENLKDDSQVVKAIEQYKKDNPNGQECSQQSQNSTQQAPTNSTPQSSAAPSGTTTPPATNNNTRNP